MKKMLLFLTVLSIYTLNTASAQTSPLHYEASYTGDLVNNYYGGLKKGSGYIGLANLKISFDTKNAGLWDNGTFFINAANTHGGTPTGDLIGDYQGVSNIEAGNQAFIQELWLKQSFGEISLTLGLQDLASEFAVSEYGSLFLNGSFGTHSTISHNVPAPVFPLTALSAQIAWNMSESSNAKLALFDGYPDDFETNPYNISWHLNSKDGLFAISEFDYTAAFSENITGTYKIGAYYHNHLNITDQTGQSLYTDNYGLYLTADQLLLNNAGEQKLALFAQAGISPYEKNENNFYMGLGLNYSGLIKNRTDDILGIAVAYASLTNKLTKSETAVELSYKAQITENLFVQPDLQYIIHPAGTDLKLPSTLAGIFRMGVNF